MKHEGPDDQRGQALPKRTLWMAAGLTVALVSLPMIVRSIEDSLGEKRLDAALERLSSGGAALYPEDLQGEVGSEAEDGAVILAALAAIDEPWNYESLSDVNQFASIAHELEADGRDVAASLMDDLRGCTNAFAGVTGDVSSMWSPMWDPAKEREPLANSSRAACERKVLETQVALCAAWTAAAEDICSRTWLDPGFLQATPKMHDSLSITHLGGAFGMSGLGYTSSSFVGGFIGSTGQSWPPLYGSEGRQGRGIQGAAIGLGGRARVAALDGDATQAALDLERALCLAQLFSGLADRDAGRYWELVMLTFLGDLESVLFELPAGEEFEDLATRLASVDARAELRAIWAGLRAETLADMREVRENGEDRDPMSDAILVEWLESCEERLGFPAWKLMSSFEASGLAEWEIAMHETVAIRVEDQFQSITSEILRIEALVLLARTALVGRAHGKDAAATFAASLVDPFDGLPLRTRAEADGSLRIWSIGRDGVDDGGYGGADHVWVVL